MGHTPYGYRIENGIAVIDNDAADSCGIAMFGVIGDKNKLELET